MFGRVIARRLLGMSTWKVAVWTGILTAGIVGSTAFIAGIRWEKADRYDEALAYISAIEAQAAASLNTLSTRWNEAADAAQIRVEEWNLQNQSDQELFDRLLAGQADIRSKFDELDNDIFITTDFGTCELSDDAVRLLREAANAANARVSED